jgi:hypothetical protein
MLPLRVERTSENMEKENYVPSKISVCLDGDNEDNRLLCFNICSRVNICRHFRGSWFPPHLYTGSLTLNLATTVQPETLVPMYQVTRRNIPEDSSFVYILCRCV